MGNVQRDKCKGNITNYVKDQIQFSQVYGNLYTHHKNKNRQKSHDQCINLYYYLFFFISQVSYKLRVVFVIIG